MLVVVIAGLSDDGVLLDDAECRRFFDLPAAVGAPCDVPADVRSSLDRAHAEHRKILLERMMGRDAGWFDVETEKLDRWADDRRASFKAQLDEIDDALRDAKKSARLAPTMPEKLERQRAARTLQGKRDEAWRAYDQACRENDQQHDALLDETSRRLQQQVEHDHLFTLRWTLS